MAVQELRELVQRAAVAAVGIYGREGGQAEGRHAAGGDERLFAAVRGIVYIIRHQHHRRGGQRHGPGGHARGDEHPQAERGGGEHKAVAQRAVRQRVPDKEGDAEAIKGGKQVGVADSAEKLARVAHIGVEVCEIPGVEAEGVFAQQLGDGHQRADGGGGGEQVDIIFFPLAEGGDAEEDAAVQQQRQQPVVAARAQYHGAAVGREGRREAGRGHEGEGEPLRQARPARLFADQQRAGQQQGQIEGAEHGEKEEFATGDGGVALRARPQGENEQHQRYVLVRQPSRFHM